MKTSNDLYHNARHYKKTHLEMMREVKRRKKTSAGFSMPLLIDEMWKIYH